MQSSVCKRSGVSPGVNRYIPPRAAGKQRKIISLHKILYLRHCHLQRCKFRINYTRRLNNVTFEILFHYVIPFDLNFVI